MNLQPNYIVDKNNNKIAVQLDIQTYEKITEALENFALYKFMEENSRSKKLSMDDAKKFYRSLKDNES